MAIALGAISITVARQKDSEQLSEQNRQNIDLVTSFGTHIPIGTSIGARTIEILLLLPHILHANIKT